LREVVLEEVALGTAREGIVANGLVDVAELQETGPVRKLLVNDGGSFLSNFVAIKVENPVVG